MYFTSQFQVSQCQIRNNVFFIYPGIAERSFILIKLNLRQPTLENYASSGSCTIAFRMVAILFDNVQNPPDLHLLFCLQPIDYRGYPFFVSLINKSMAESCLKSNLFKARKCLPLVKNFKTRSMRITFFDN